MNKIKRKNIALREDTFFLRPGTRYFITRNPFSLLHEWREWMFAVLFGLGLILLLLVLPTLYREARLLLEETRTVSAEVIERETRTCRTKNRSYTCYYATYRYFQGDRSFIATRRDDSAQVGRVYEVTYLEADPYVHHVGDKRIVLADDAWLLLVAALLLGLGLWPILEILIGYRPYLREGEWVYGELQTIRGDLVKQGKSSTYKISVRYGYTDPYTLRAETGGQVEDRNDLHRRRLPAKGTPILLLVRPDGRARAL